LNKKQTLKEKQAQHQSGPSKKQQEKEAVAIRSTRRWLGILLAVIGMAVYANTFSHEYVLDDWGLMPENKITRRGFDGLGEVFRTSYRTGMDVADYSLYRPLSKATFAVEWGIAPNQPMLGHIDNILLYGLACYVLFLMLSRLFKQQLLVPFLATVLFAVHPLHSEVVANIKSRDEIMCLLFACLSLISILNYTEKNSPASLIKASLFFFLSILSKESAITWIAVIPLALYFFTDAGKKHYTVALLATLVPTIVFLLIRKNVLGSGEGPTPVVDNYLVGIKDFLTQRTSAIALLGFYAYKLFVPYPLLADGSYSHFPPYPVTDWHFLVTFIVFSALVVYAIRRFTSRDPIAFAILYFFITLSLVSNVVILIGTNYAERLMYAPSLGWCILLAVLLSRFVGQESSASLQSVSTFFKTNTRAIGITLLICMVFSSVTFSRNRDWKDNYTLYKSEISKVPNSAHMRFYIANHITSSEFLEQYTDSLQQEAFRKEAIGHLDTAIAIYPAYADAYQRRAYIRFKVSDYKGAEPDFIKSLELNNTQSVTHNNYGNLLFNTGRFEEAKVHFEQAIRYNPRFAHALNNLGSVYGVFGEGERQAAANDPANQTQHLVKAKENFETAIVYFKRSIENDPDYSMPYTLMGMTYRNLGDEANAQMYFDKAEQVKKIKRYNADN
jgi:tetratricopeptide (TPR) repeat protein